MDKRRCRSDLRRLSEQVAPGACSRDSVATPEGQESTQDSWMATNLERFPPELRLEVYKDLLPAAPVRLDNASYHSTRTDFLAGHLHLLTFPNAQLSAEYLHEYFKHTAFSIKKRRNVRNMPLETGLVLMREANIQRIRMLSVELDDWLTVSLVFKGSKG